MEHLVVSFLNTSLEQPDRLATPMGAAQWWASVQPVLPMDSAIIHGKPRFTMDLAAELRALRAHVVALAGGGQAAYQLGEVPGAAAVFFPLLQALGTLHASGGLGRVKRCGEQACRRYFLDQTKNRSKRWCALRCMERARAPRRRRIGT
jgi:predicted RNA-binding Zn ribbon-like protein